VAVVTPNRCEAIKVCLDRAGGRDGRDYLVLARVPAAVPTEA
jgi:hypothetical protein